MPIEEISCEALATLLAGEKKPRLVDVRSVEEHAYVSLPGSLLIPLPEIEELMSYCNGEFAVDLPAEPEIIGDKNWGQKYELAA